MASSPTPTPTPTTPSKKPASKQSHAPQTSGNGSKSKQTAAAAKAKSHAINNQSNNGRATAAGIRTGFDRSDIAEVRASYTARWSAEQNALRSRLIEHDHFTWTIRPSHDPRSLAKNQLQYVGGVDISFVGEDDKRACAALMVLNYPQLQVVYEDYEMVELTQPYISGFLAFREVDFLIALINRLRATKPSLVPQVIMVDGNGVLHTRGFGLASHLGVLADIPTVGCAKKLLFVDGMGKDKTTQYCRERLQKGGDYVPLMGNSGRIWATAVRATDDAVNQLYVSVGHRISLETATQLVLRVCQYRIPEPIRQADLRSREWIRRWQVQQAKHSNPSTIVTATTATATTTTTTTVTSTSTATAASAATPTVTVTAPVSSS